MTVFVAGGGAFGTALAVTLAADGRDTVLWARNDAEVRAMCKTGANRRLPGVTLPASLKVTSDLPEAGNHYIVLLAMPAQAMRGFLAENREIFSGKALVACCKGIDLTTMQGPTASIVEEIPTASAAILTGPSFAADIARGLPTALTLACANADVGELLQSTLSTQTLRLYRTTDTTGAELGGALKNVMAIACGVTIGAGFGESARAAIMTRGFAEMQRLAARLGANPETLSGLSGFGDLALTCTSEQSRNYKFGKALGRGEAFDPTTTVEGAATAKSVRALAVKLEIDLPICAVVAALIENKTSVKDALRALLSRPLKEE